MMTAVTDNPYLTGDLTTSLPFLQYVFCERYVIYSRNLFTFFDCGASFFLIY